MNPESSNLLPPPFAWIDIPAGSVTIQVPKQRGGGYIPAGESRTFDVPAFAISKYLITNAQYAKFMEAGGYREKRWWTEAGWESEQPLKWSEPDSWHDEKWNQPDHPVVNVSWYEALAFCRWLSEVSGEDIMLPTDQQWQRAAQGDDNRTYPWGNDADGKQCNNSIMPNKSTGTTPVTAYEGKGDSAFGVADMAGNVWEWCLTAYETGSQDMEGTNFRIFRGGAWDSFVPGSFWVGTRGTMDPGFALTTHGFRIVRS